MRPTRPLIVLVFFVTGLVCGLASSRYIQSRCRLEPENETLSPYSPTPSTTSDIAAPSFQTHSVDTAEILLNLPARELYGRLALWLLDADEAAISAFWKAYQQRGGTDYETGRLIMVHWTRIHPQGAISAATDDEDAYLRWTSWTCHDPRSALAADEASGGKTAGGIWLTIGQFHANWLLAHFDEVPEKWRDNAIQGLGSGSFNSVHPLKALKLAERWNNANLTGSILSSAIRKSPLDAWFWLKEYRSEHPDFSGSDSDDLELFFNHADPSRVGDFERIAATLPPGKMKRDFESATMELLARTDPEAALAIARNADDARIKAEHLAIAAKAFVHADPERAFQIAEELLAACPDVMHFPELTLPDGTANQSSGERLYNIYPLFQALCARDGDRLMESYLAHDPTLQLTGTLTAISKTWADQRPDTCAAWLNRQTDPAIREPIVRVLASRLAEQDRYDEALDWAASLRGSDENPTDSIFRRWRNLDDQSALDWLDTANLPEERKDLLREGGNQ